MEDDERVSPKKFLIPVIKEALNHVRLKLDFSPGIEYKKWKPGLDGIQQFEEVTLPRLTRFSVISEGDSKNGSIENKLDLPPRFLHEESTGLKLSYSNKRYTLRLIVEGPGDVRVIALA